MQRGAKHLTTTTAETAASARQPWMSCGIACTPTLLLLLLLLLLLQRSSVCVCEVTTWWGAGGEVWGRGGSGGVCEAAETPQGDAW